MSVTAPEFDRVSVGDSVGESEAVSVGESDGVSVGESGAVPVGESVDVRVGELVSPLPPPPGSGDVHPEHTAANPTMDAANLLRFMGS